MTDKTKPEQQVNAAAKSIPTASNPTAALDARPRLRTRRRRWLAAGAVLMALLPFVLLEAGLRLFGVGLTQAELHSGFGSTAPLFELDAGSQTYRTSLSKLQFFVSQEFPATPDAKEFRFFVLGGSTVQGRPFSVDTSFTKWLELNLNAAAPATHYVGINCGGVSYASYRLQPVLHEVLQYQPSLIVLATGHNEFLEDRTYTNLKSRSNARLWLENTAGNLRTVRVLTALIGGTPPVEPQHATEPEAETVKARLDDESGYASYHRDPAWAEQVRQQYADSVQAMVKMCRDAGVPVVLVRLGANLRDCPPFKSELPAELSVAQQQEWQALFDQATELQATDPNTALNVYEQTLLIDSEHALVHFRMARCLQQLGRTAAAKVHFQQAQNDDVCPLRMTMPLDKSLQRIAADFKVPLVDGAASLEAAARDSIPGHDYYLDHVHPTIGGHQLIADRIAARCIADGLVPAVQHLAADRKRSRDYLRSLPGVYYSNGRRRIGWLEGWARRQRLLDETRPVDVAGRVDAIIRSLELSDFTTAREQWPDVMADTAAVPLLLQRSATLFQQGHNGLAQWILSELATEDLADAPQETLALASLIMAVDEKSPTRVTAAWQPYPQQWIKILAADTTGWKRAMPDVIQEAQALLERKSDLGQAD